MLPATTRRIGWILSIVTLATILFLTLTPEPGESPGGFWCLVCGQLGAVDVTANVILFIPMGLSFALAMNRRWLPLAIIIGTTVMIETLQIRVIPGRDASVSDILSNSLGGLIGIELSLRRKALLWPTSSVAVRLAVGWFAVFAAICAVTAWAVRPAFVPRSLWVQWVPPRAGYDPFTGKLMSFDIDGIPLPLGYPSGSLNVDTHLMSDSWRATATIDRDGLTNVRSVIVRISEEFTQPFALEQRYSDLTCLQKTRSADFRFRSPRIALPNAFQLSTGKHPDVLQLVCAHRDRSLVASAHAGDEVREEVVPMSPSLGWTLVSPFDIPLSSRTWWISALWLIGLLIPAGYWWTAATHGAVAVDRRRRSSIIAAGLLCGSALGFVLVPLVAGTALGTWWEWLFAAIGIVCGSLLGRLARGPLATIRDDAPHLLRSSPPIRFRA